MGKALVNFRVRICIVSKSAANCDMSDCIVETTENVTLIGAGPVNKGILADAVRIAPYLVAADGGAELAQKYGKTPKKVIGDLDSVDRAILAKFPAGTVHRIDEQESTDFDKCLRNISAPLVVGVGFIGGRADHQLAALHSLVRHSDRSCVLLGPEDVVFHARAKQTLELEPGTRVSLFPLARVSGRSAGLKWPINGLEFEPGQKIGTSNRSTVGQVVLEVDGPGMLVIVPRAAFARVVGALSAK